MSVQTFDPMTLRYERFMHVVSSVEGEYDTDEDILDMDSGACEAIPAKR